jgi:hypothetical protein
MKKYSITNEIDGATVAGEIAALQAADAKKSILVVEGADDERFFKPFINSDRCSVVISAGWENAVSGLMIVRKNGRKGVLVVIDLDYRAVLGTHSDDPDIIYTADHDIEIAMVSSTAFDKVIYELGAHHKINNFSSSIDDVRELIYSLARPIGALRLYAQETGLSLKFDDYDYKHMTLDMTIDVPEFVRVIFARSKIGLSDCDAVIVSMRQKKASIHDNQLCCGHDICVAIGKSLQSKLGNQNAKFVTRELMGRNLRLAYGEAEFVNTHLYKEVKAWECSNPSFIVLRV